MQNILLRLQTPGFVVFDPVLMSNFIKEKEIKNTDVFQYFIDFPEIGDIAISDGIVLPIYPVPPDDYVIFFDEKKSHIDLNVVFSYSGFPLRCQSGILVATDIYALMDWEDDFFRDYEKNYEKHSATNDMVKVSPGLFSVTVIGGRLPNKALGADLAYAIIIDNISRLPKRDDNKDIDDYDFNLLSQEPKGSK